MHIQRINSVNNQQNFKGIFDPNIMVTGSSGYIGSHVIKNLVQEGYNCIICCRNRAKKEYLENLIKQINRTKSDKSLCSFTDIDFTDRTATAKLIKETSPIDAVIHLAGSTYNAESLQNPRKYYENNVLGSINLANSLLDNNIDSIVYLSTSSTYGKTEEALVKESSQQNPQTPYARTKFITEQIFQDYSIQGLKTTILRLFNVAGASTNNDLDIGRNFITVLLNFVKNDKIFSLMGHDYPTKDGTCVKDFVHVEDVSSAIEKALTSLLSTQKGNIYNVGSGIGTSLGEVLGKTEGITKKKVQFRLLPRLETESPEQIADISRIRKELDWNPQKSIEDILGSCWKWIINH